MLERNLKRLVGFSIAHPKLVILLTVIARDVTSFSTIDNVTARDGELAVGPVLDNDNAYFTMRYAF